MIKFWSSMTVGRMAGEHYFIWIRASLVWKSPDSSWYPRAHAWKIIGYDLQKWKVIGNNVHRTTCHPIPPLCKMISEICYSFPLVQYKYCLFADIPVEMVMYPEDDISGLFRFATSDVVEQSIDFDEWCSTFRHIRRDLDVST